jgi:N-acetylmuramoyl-L-alanine amidase
MAFSIREVSDKAVKLGQQITALEAKIPARPAPSTNRVSTVRSTGTTAATSQPGMYTIAAGDTLGKIAKSNNTTVDALQKANPSLDPKRLKIGASIKIP